MEVSPSTRNRPPMAKLAMRPLNHSAPSDTGGGSVRFKSTNKSCSRQGIYTMGPRPRRGASLALGVGTGGTKEVGTPIPIDTEGSPS